MPSNGFVFEEEPDLTGGDLLALLVTLPNGEQLRLWSQVELVHGEVHLRQFSIYGAEDGPLKLGAAMLRRLAQAAMEAFDAACIRIVEASRTSGASPGRRPPTITFRRRVP